MQARSVPGGVLVLACLLLPAQAPRAEVYTVDDDGPADFADFDAALDVVLDGDTLLVREGYYYALRIQGVSVSVIAVPGETVQVGFVSIWNLTRDQPVYLRGLTLVGGESVDGMLSTFDCAASVWLDQIDVDPLPIFSAIGPPAQAYTGSHFERCDQVILTGCSLRGHDAAPFKYEPVTSGPALALEDGARVVMHDTLIEGGAGTDGYVEAGFGLPLAGDPGARGALVDESLLLLAGSTLRGGRGGTGLEGPPCTEGGAGGDGGVLSGASARVELLSSAVIAGSLGQGGAGCAAGAPGQDVVLEGGATLAARPGAARSLSLGPLAAPDDEVTLGLHHGAGETWFLVAGPQAAWLDLPAVLGPVLVTPAVVLALDPFGQAGTSELSLRAPSLPGGWPTLELYVQGVVFGAEGPPVASSPARLTVLDLASHLP